MPISSRRPFNRDVMDSKRLRYAPWKVLIAGAFLATCGNAQIYYDALLAGRLLAPAFTPNVLYAAYAAAPAPPPVGTPPPPPPLAPTAFQPSLQPVARPIQIQTAPTPVASVGPVGPGGQPALSAPISAVPTEIIPASCPPSSICHYPLTVAPPPDYPTANDGGRPAGQPANGLPISDATQSVQSAQFNQIGQYQAAQIAQTQVTVPDAEEIRHPFEELLYRPQPPAPNVPAASRPEVNILSSSGLRGPIIPSNSPLCPGAVTDMDRPPAAPFPTGPVLAEAPIALSQTLLAYSPCLTAASVLFADPTQMLAAGPALELIAPQAAAPPTVAVPSLPSAAFLPPVPSAPPAAALPTFATVPLTAGFPPPVQALPPATVAQFLAAVPPPGLAAYSQPQPVPAPTVSYAPYPAGFVVAPYPTAYGSHKQQAPEEVSRDRTRQIINHAINHSNTPNDISKAVRNDKPIPELPSTAATVNGVHLPVIRRGRLARRHQEPTKSKKDK